MGRNEKGQVTDQADALRTGICLQSCPLPEQQELSKADFSKLAIHDHQVVMGATRLR
jgi:hypothetical protein